MSEPLSAKEFRSFVELYTRNHQDLMLAVAGVITDVNDHVDDRFTRLEQLLEVRDRVDKMQVLLAEQFGRDVLARAGL